MSPEYEKLAKQCQKFEQQLGVAQHKLKQRKNDKSDYNTELSKLKKENDTQKEDLKMANKNLDNMAADLVTLKRAFKILTLEGKDKGEFQRAVAQ